MVIIYKMSQLYIPFSPEIILLVYQALNAFLVMVKTVEYIASHRTNRNCQKLPAPPLGSVLSDRLSVTFLKDRLANKQDLLESCLLYRLLG